MARVIETHLKTVSEVLDYPIDWDDGWLATSETISTSVWTVPAGLTEDSESETTTVATVWISGGTAGSRYRITNTITTNQGRTGVRSKDILVVSDT